jgi:hypothetical protein
VEPLDRTPPRVFGEGCFVSPPPKALALAVGFYGGGFSLTLALSRRERGAAPIELAALCALGLVWGLLYGWIINLYFWPFAAGPLDQSWTPGTGAATTLARYALFYVTTSLVWDLARSVGNVAFILLLGRPLVRAFLRFQRRFHFEVGSASD